MIILFNKTHTYTRMRIKPKNVKEQKTSQKDMNFVTLTAMNETEVFKEFAVKSFSAKDISEWNKIIQYKYEV
jgi:hypothetical protein